MHSLQAYVIAQKPVSIVKEALIYIEMLNGKKIIFNKKNPHDYHYQQLQILIFIYNSLNKCIHMYNIHMKFDYFSHSILTAS